MESNKESLLVGYPNPISYECTKMLLVQMEKCVCKIKIGNTQGTGSFCKIPFPNKKNMLPVLITNNHIINKEILNKKDAKISIDIKEKSDIKELNLNNRKKYTNEEHDITIIEIKENDEIKNYLELDDIITNDILNDNPTSLEWLSITRVGMNYVVRVEERIIKKEENGSLPRDIIAKKDGMITKVINNKGESLVRSGDYVKKGDCLISGKIMLYDEVKGTTSASGTVYANVWYETEIKIPLTREEIIKTGKKRYNININNKIFLKNKYKFFYQENIKELKILGLKIKIYREVEYDKKIVKLSDEMLDKEAFKLLEENFNKKLKGSGEIISKKVLKKSQNNSTIEYRIFVVTNEIISGYSYFSEGDINDSSKSN